jgi:transposase
MGKKLTVKEFFQKFSDDNVCLEHLFNVRFGQGHVCPKCERSAKWYKIKAERAYSCQWCGHHLHPTVDTLFEGSRTSLQSWFYAIYLFTTTRHGVSAKELQRQLGVTYKCAWRMGHEIRKHMALVDGEEVLFGEVEIDETYIGGKSSGKRGRGSENKTVVLGMKQRGGKLITKIVDNVRKNTLQPIIKEHVKGGSTIHTDELLSYKGLDKAGYEHKTVNHGSGQYVSECGSHVNSVENVWSGFKRSIKGTHIHVSKKHLGKYAKEFEYRFNARDLGVAEMFDDLTTNF